MEKAAFCPAICLFGYTKIYANMADTLYNINVDGEKSLLVLQVLMTCYQKFTCFFDREQSSKVFKEALLLFLAGNHATQVTVS